MLTFENLVDLGGALRRERFDVSPHQLLAAQDLLLHLAVNGRMPASRAELERWLAPVFCSNPDEQERFPRLYREWLAPLDGPAPGSGGTPDTAGTAGGESPPPPDWRRIGRRLAYLAAAVLLAGGPVAGWFGWDYYLKERTLQGSVAGDHGAIGGATIGFVNRDGKETKTCEQTGGKGLFSCTYHRSDLPATLDVAAKDYLSQSQTIESPPETRIDFQLQPELLPPPPPPDGAAATPVATLVPPPAIQKPVPPPQPPAEPLLPAGLRVALALLALGALWWGLWSVYRRGNTRRAVLRRFPAGTAAERYRLHRLWSGGLPRLFAGRELRDALRELRRHRSVLSRRLDVAATVKATVSQRGRFTPVYGRRRAAPEYLVLVDRRSGRDQQARLLDELLARLRRDGVYLDCWDFNGDPRLCWKSTGEARFVGPADLAGRYPEHALLVFSDADGLFEPLSGKVVDWLDAFGHWSQRAIFIAESRKAFAYREHALEQAGFAVLPATPAGLLAFALADESPPADNDAWPWPYPQRLARNPARWLDETPPLAEDEQALCTELRRYLGPMGYFWLAACAIYPAMRWEVTVAVGTRLLDSESLARILPALVRLPWFRLGAMPDWLRRRLVGELPPYWKRQARNALWHLLDAAGQGGSDKLPLEFAEEDPPRSEQRRRRREAAALASLDRGHPLNDRVLLATLTGDTIDPLTLAAPPLLQRLWYLNGQSRYGLRPIIPALAMLVVVAGLWWLTVPGEQPPIAQGYDVAVKPPPARQTALRPLAYSPDGTRLASTSDEAATVLWDVAGRKESLPPLTGHDAQVSALALGKDVLAEGSEQGTIYRLDPLTGGTLGDPIAAHTGPVQALTVSPDGRTLASGGADGQVKFHDVAPAAPAGAAGSREPKAALPSPFLKVAFDPRSSRLAGLPGELAATIERGGKSPGAAAPARVAATKRVEPHQGAVSAVAFSSDGRTLASAGADGRVLLWEVASGQPFAELASEAAAGSSHRPALTALAWRADGVLATGDDQGAIVLWNVAARAQLPGSLAKHDARVAAIAFSPGGATLASASDDGSLRLWDVAGRRLRGVPLAVHGEAVAGVAWNPDGIGLASLGRSGTVVLWSFADTGPAKDERVLVRPQRKTVTPYGQAKDERVSVGPHEETVTPSKVDGERVSPGFSLPWDLHSGSVFSR
ncbi:MAG: WD40 repeat domain-containing protein [Candidatus Accumulibacter sp.]|uniref:WD40 repeat domain-containing protein n=1 Tax=Candidatus Accumulibacter proximus TaxID=2954385 RepID=A0A935Q299_9PROT|nr:WD40 repeat domain-containing protein [Candidatus Accumulibacter proximus]